MFTFVIALLAGLAVGAVLTKYWDNIRAWLNNEAADWVERNLGYKARRGLFKAVSVADTIFRQLNGRSVAFNTSTLFSKMSGDSYTKTVITHYDRADELGDEWLDDVRNNNVQELDYRQ
ncbi:MAG: hypothetical protein LBS62_12140 [Clostridiales bacterium]|jgi:hypothetical protein|nr:hypothetical protein [Clostridiales bacterium]